MRSRIFPLGIAVAGFTLLTLALFRPTPHDVAHTAPAFHGEASDALLLMWATSHVSRALFTDPVHLFEAGIFHPEHRTLAFGDHMIGQALLGLPVWLATHNPLLEYNLLALASYVLGGCAMYAYASEVVSGTWPAVAAALVFAFTPYRFNSPLWLQVLMTPFMPLALLFWLRFVRGLAWRDWALWIACWVAHSLMGMYLTFYFALTMGCLGAFALAAAPTRGAARLWAGTLLAPLAAGLLLAPTLWPYLELRAVQGNVRTVAHDTQLFFLLPGPGTLSGQLLGALRPGQLGPGLVAWGLALVGLVVGVRRRPRGDGLPQRFLWGVHALGLVLTLALVLTPARLLLALPGFDMLRVTNRAFFVSLVFLAIFAGEAVVWAARRAATPGVAIALVILVAADVGLPPRERKPMPVGDEIAPVYRFIASLPPDTVIYEGAEDLRSPPLAMYYAIRPMYYSIFHAKRLAQGYSGFSSPGGAYVTMQLSRFPDPEALRLLDAVGVRYVLWHFPRAPAVDAFLATVQRPALDVAARFGADVVFRVGVPPAAPPVAPSVRPLPRSEWRLETNLADGSLDALRDGERDTVWHGVPEKRDQPPRLLVDLGRSWPVGGVRAVPDDANAPSLYLADLELSLDGDHWQSAGAWLLPDALATLVDRPRELRYYEARFATTTARYIRLVNAPTGFVGWPWDVAELDVLGDCAAAAIPGCTPP